MNTALTHRELQLETNRRQILRMALPISLAMLIPQLNYVTNTVFLSYNETVLATAGITGVFYLIFSLVGNGLNAGLQGLIARRAGENRPQAIGPLYVQGIWVSMFYACAAIILTWVAAPVFFHSVLHSPRVIDMAILFLQIRVLGIPFLYVMQMSNALLVGTNHSRYLKYGLWTMAGLNIVLDYALIYGKLGFPELGFNGAAYASVVAEIAGMCVVVGIILVKKIHLRFSILHAIRYNVSLAKLIFRQSLPLVVQWLLSILAWMIFYIFIEHLGERPLAISNTMRTIFGIVGIFGWAFASTCNAMVSNIIGQGREPEVRSLITRIMTLSIVFTSLLCLLINLVPSLFLGIYTNDPAFVNAGIPVLRLVSVAIIVMAAATVWLNAVTGTGHTRVNLLIEIVAIILYTVYIYLAMKWWNLNLAWAWASELLYWGSIGLLSYLYILSGKWKKKII
jgi:putative MATE family efflux protein